MVRIGIIGAGGNGSGHARAFAKLAGRCRVAAVADPVVEAAQKLAAAHDARAVADPADLLDEVDAVVVSSPNDLHPEHTILAAQAGKHVLCEKPMALSTADADRMADAVRQAGVASLVGFSVRFDRSVTAMRRAFRAGRLGDMISIWSRRLTWFDPAMRSAWRMDYARSGGLMAELLAHEIDWIVDVAGDPVSLYCRKASRRHTDPGENDHVWLTLAFDSEATGTIEGSQMAPIADYYRGIVGTEASAYTAEWGGKVLMQKAGEKKTAELERPAPLDKHAHFLDVIEGRVESACDVEWGRKIVRISEKAIESAVSGRVVGL